MTTNAKKQNRILTAALILIIASLIALIALTSGANRKAKPPAENVPPVGQKADDRSGDKPDESAAPAQKPDGKNASPDEDALAGGTGDSDADKAPDEEQERRLTSGEDEKASAEPDEAVPASAGIDEVPVFRAPLENAAAVKGCSLTVPVFSATMNDYRVHRGIDFACAPGTPVLAAADGVISSVSKDPMMGWTVTLSHSGGAETRYAGLSEESVNLAKTGDKVYAGQVIGASGETALIESAEENHLHFELAVNGRAADPADYMDVVWLTDMFED